MKAKHHHTYKLWLALSTVVVLISGIIVWNLSEVQGENNHNPTGLASVQHINAQQAWQKINYDGALVIDVRERHEFISGHVPGSIHIPLGALSARIATLDGYSQRPIVLSCRSGNRSSYAWLILKQHGFEDVSNLQGGMIAWRQAGLPIGY